MLGWVGSGLVESGLVGFGLVWFGLVGSGQVSCYETKAKEDFQPIAQTDIIKDIAAYRLNQPRVAETWEVWSVSPKNLKINIGKGYMKTVEVK